MKGKLFFMICVLIIAACASVVPAKDNTTIFGYEIISDTYGSSRLKITTEIPSYGWWLGVTFYPPDVKDAARESKSQIYPLKVGRSTTDLVIDLQLRNGTFEAAVWGQKLSSQECTSTDTACQKLGYKLIGMKAYIWGYLSGAK